MKVIQSAFTILTLGFFFTGCGGGSDPIGNDTNDDNQPPQNSPVLVASGTIGPDGGTLVVNGIDTAVDGVEFQVPPGAFESEHNCTILYYNQPATNLPNPDGILVSRVIRLEYEKAVKSLVPLTLTIPFDKSKALDTDNLVGCFIDLDTGLIRCTGVVEIDELAGTLAIRTCHPGDYAIYYWESSVKGSQAARHAESGESDFKAITDGFFIQNFKSWDTNEIEGRNSLGTALYSSWYYTMRNLGLIEDSGDLIDKYFQGIPDTGHDDVTAHELAARAHMLSRPNWIAILESLEASGAMGDDQLAGNVLINALSLTGQPQLLIMWTHTPLFKGYAVTVYDYLDGEFLLYDSEFPGVEQALPFNFDTGFSGYNTGGCVFTEFAFDSIDTYIAEGEFESIYTRAESGFPVHSIYPTISLDIEDNMVVYTDYFLFTGKVDSGYKPYVYQPLDFAVLNNLTNGYQKDTTLVNYHWPPESKLYGSVFLDVLQNDICIFGELEDVDFYYGAVKDFTIVYHIVPGPYAPIAIAKADKYEAEPGEAVYFEDDGSYDPDGGDIQEYEWDLDNTGEYFLYGPATVGVFDSIGTHVVKFRVKDDDGFLGHYALEIIVGESSETSPVAFAKAGKYVVGINEPVNLSAEGSYDPDGGELVQYSWDLENDGRFDLTGFEVIAQYPTYGVYTVRLQVLDDEGNFGYDAFEIEIGLFEVEFTDPILEGLVRSGINKPSGPIFQTDLLELTELDARLKFVKNLEGLQYCIALEKLNLDFCSDIHDISPLSALTNLTWLSLWYVFMDSLEPVSDLTNLTYLNIYYNSIEDLSPIAGLVELETLLIGVNPFTDISALGGLKKLRILDMFSTNVEDLSPLESLPELNTLIMKFCDLVDLSPLGNLTGLTFLDLDGNGISDISPLGGLVNLTTLILNNNQVSEIESLSGLTKLTQLSISENQVSDVSPLQDLTSLENLYLSLNQITDISSLQDLTNLEHLYLSVNQITDISPLVTNSNNGGLGDGDKVRINVNPLSDTSINDYIPQLQANGVNVYW